MSNYTKSTNFTAKDALPSGDSGKIIRGSEFDTEFTAIQTAVATKTDKAVPTSAGNVATLDVAGNLTDSTKAAPSGVFVGTTDTQTLSNKDYNEKDTTLTGTTPAISGTGIRRWTLSGNSTPTDSLNDGDSVTLLIDDGTAYTITWTMVDLWIGGVEPTLATTGLNVIELFKSDGVVIGAAPGVALAP